MTPGDVASTRYGRRGGGWLPAGTPPAAPPTTAPGPRGGNRHRVSRHAAALFHPTVIAQGEAHARQCGADPHTLDECTAWPDPDRLAAWWAGRARMAAARRDAGQPLDDTDQEALAR